MKSYINELQEYAVTILKEGNLAKPLWMLAKYNCSEVSWLLGLKVLEDLGPSTKPFILKGDVNNSDIEKIENIHDILGYFDANEDKFIIIDPTIWQFYPNKRSIYIGSFGKIEDVICAVNKFYAGKWEKSYYVDEINEDINENRKLVKLNCDQAPNWLNR